MSTTPRRSSGAFVFPFTEYEVTRALRLANPQGLARREARRFTSRMRRVVGLIGSRTLDVPFAALLGLLAARSRELEARADEHVRKEIAHDYPFDLLFEESHRIPPRSREDRWRAWEMRKQDALALARRRYPALRRDR